MDFLGLRNLTVIDKTLALINLKGKNIDLENLPFKDEQVYKLFTKGNTIGVFQFESSGMREFLKKLKEFPYDQLKGSYASTFKTAYKRIIAESSIKNKKKI